MQRPKLFDFIEHHVPVGQGYTHEGLVTQQFSTQFGYVKADGHFMMSTLSEDWKPMAKRAERQHDTVEAPAVWRDHQSRTCIVLKVKDGEVSYIPLQVDVPFSVEVAGEKEFTSRLYLEPVEYPVSRAARLFVEYARNTGATDSVLEALAPFTNITEEEKSMARTKASARAAEADKPKRQQAKQTKAKSAAERKPRESAASVYRDQIRSGKTTKQVVAAVNRKFPDKGREDYVKYYWRELVKKGEDIPAPKGLEI